MVFRAVRSAAVAKEGAAMVEIDVIMVHLSSQAAEAKKPQGSSAAIKQGIADFVIHKEHRHTPIFDYIRRRCLGYYP